ncbi:TonB-dependent receptor [Caulobacter sp. KR2-114]|uniref:TonB-dependent receptor n=1 Tax=Caulobacter sp. KR2-114 TaxID=3400912 RepID=UPI003C008835
MGALRNRRRLLTATALIGGALLSALASAAAAQPRTYDIPAETLSRALRDYGRQTGQQIIFTEDLVRGRQAPGVKGAFEPAEALRVLLRGSGLRGETTPAGVVMIVRNAVPPPDAAAAGAANEPAQVSEVTVTGSHIRGSAPVGSELIVVGRAEMDRRGYITLSDVLHGLPQNFRGGIGENTVIGEASSNISGATGVNLRGLGSDSTLVLVDGRRLPVAGLDANFTDLSSIPLAAVDRVEVLADGASAVYGADAVAGVVNVILKKDFEGAETRFRTGVGHGDFNQVLASQTIGYSWTGGSFLGAYEYFSQDRLRYTDRPFTRSQDLRPLGGSDFRRPYSNPANIFNLAFQPVFAIPAGQDGRHLTAGQLIPGQLNLGDGNWALDLFPKQERNSLYGHLRQQVSEKVELFAEARYSRRVFDQRIGSFFSPIVVPSTNAFFVDPLNQGLTILGYDFGKDFGPTIGHGTTQSYGGAAGAEVRLPREWRLNVYGASSRELTVRTNGAVDFGQLAVALADSNPQTAFNPFGDGSFTNPQTLKAVYGTSKSHIDSTVSSANAVVDGPLARLGGGDLKVAAGLDFREERFRDSFTGPGYASDKRLRREVYAAFAELDAPLVSAENARPGFQGLNLSLAGRYEHYSDEELAPTPSRRPDANSFNPKIGLSWSPVVGLEARAAYGRSFRAPNLTTLGATPSSGLLALTDPKSPTGQTTVLILDGVAPDLKNETSRNWTFGLAYRPPSLKDLHLSLTYFDVDFRNRVSSPAAVGSVLIQEAQYASIVTRNPSQAQLTSLCSAPGFSGDPASCTPAIVGAVVDTRLQNAARNRTRGLDIEATYGFEVGAAGRIDLSLNASYLFEYSQSFGASSRVVELVGTVHYPARLNMHDSVVWTWGAFSTSADVNFTSGYKDTVSAPARDVDSFTTVDLGLTYDLGASHRDRRLEGLRLSMNVENLFDADPPFVNNTDGVGYDAENADPRGRFFSVALTKRW